MGREYVPSHFPLNVAIFLGYIHNQPTNQPTPPVHTLRPSIPQDLMLTLDPEGSPTVGGPVLLGRDGRGLTRAFTRTKTLEGRYTFGWP